MPRQPSPALASQTLLSVPARAALGNPLTCLMHDLQIGEYFEGILPSETRYHVNAYLNYRFPEDWIAAI